MRKSTARKHDVFLACFLEALIVDFERLGGANVSKSLVVLFENKVLSKSGKCASGLHFRWILGVILEAWGTQNANKLCFFGVRFVMIFSSMFGWPPGGGDPQTEGRRQEAQRHIRREL